MRPWPRRLDTPRQYTHPARIRSRATTSPPKSAAASPKMPCVGARAGKSAEVSSSRPDQNVQSYRNLKPSGSCRADTPAPAFRVAPLASELVHPAQQSRITRIPHPSLLWRRRNIDPVFRYQIRIFHFRPELHGHQSRLLRWLSKKCQLILIGQPAREV